MQFWFAKQNAFIVKTSARINPSHTAYLSSLRSSTISIAVLLYNKKYVKNDVWDTINVERFAGLNFHVFMVFESTAKVSHEYMHFSAL